MPNDPKEDEIPLEIWCDLTGADSSLGRSFVCPCEFPNDLCISLPLRVDHKAGGSRLTASTICRATQILRSSKHRMKNESTDEARFDAAIDLRQRAHSAVGNSFGPNDICCVLLRIACNSSLRSFFSGRLTSAQIDEYIRSADSPLGEIDHVILSELSGRILSAIFGTRSYLIASALLD